MSEQTTHIEDKGTRKFIEEDPSSFKLISTLGIAGFLAGLVLVSTYLFTLPKIEANKAAALEKAIYHVLPGCTKLVILELRDNKLVESSEEINTSKREQASKKIYLGLDGDENLIGVAIQAEEPGFQDLIVGIFGYNPEAKMIVGFEVLSSKETPGLGDKIIKDQDFIANFNALKIDPAIIPVKKGKKTGPNEVEAITGATISSKAVTRMLQKAIEEWRSPIEDYISENINK